MIAMEGAVADRATRVMSARALATVRQEWIQTQVNHASRKHENTCASLLELCKKSVPTNLHRPRAKNVRFVEMSIAMNVRLL